MKINRYTPAFIDTDTKEIYEFSSTEELLLMPWIQRRTENPGFYRFSISHTPDFIDTDTLMAEYDEGYMWWVIGFIDKTDKLSLPIWKAKYKEEPTKEVTQ